MLITKAGQETLKIIMKNRKSFFLLLDNQGLKIHVKLITMLEAIFLHKSMKKKSLKKKMKKYMKIILKTLNDFEEAKSS